MLSRSVALARMNGLKSVQSAVRLTNINMCQQMQAQNFLYRSMF